MSLLLRKSGFAVAAVIDIALHAGRQPVAAKALARRHGLSPRHLEPVLQALAHQGVLRSFRGPRGGYRLAREPRQITADEILRAIGAIEADEASAAVKSSLLAQVVMPPLAQAETALSTALAHISVEDLVRAAEMMRMSAA
jgi:Rrf2 family protein